MSQSAVSAPAHALRTTWTLQGQWSKAANVAKRRYLFWGRVSLGLSIVAAACATATNHVSADAGHRSLAAGSAVLVSILAVIGRRKTGPTALRNWIRARSASEGLKTEAYRYLTRTGPYATGAPAQTLSERMGELTKAVEDLNKLVAGIVGSGRPEPSDPLPIDQYLAQRVDSQIVEYYERNAAKEAKLVEGYQLVELLLAVTGAALAGWASVVSSSQLAPWSAVITTAMAGIAAHLSASRHESQVTTYTATKVRLQQLSDRFRDEARAKSPDQARIDQLVSECEAVISVENQGWMAEWEKPKG